MSSEPSIVPVEPNPFWRANAEKLVGESITTIEDVAKQLIVVNSLLEGIYFHAITFSDVKPALGSYWTGIIYILPIALWLISLVFAVLTLSPKSCTININSSRNSKETFENIVSKKHGRLEISETLLIVSFVALMAAVWHYLFIIPAS